MMTALLGSRKHCTRRLPTRTNCQVDWRRATPEVWAGLLWDQATRDHEHPHWLHVPCVQGNTLTGVLVTPVYAAGDGIWAREMWWHQGCWFERGDPSEPSGTYWWRGYEPHPEATPETLARCCRYTDPGPQDTSETHCRKRPGIHMPRWASRFSAPLAAVRWERLGDISERDCRREGVQQTSTNNQGETPWFDIYFTNVTREGFGYHTAREAFEELWRSIHGAWEPRQWVLVLDWGGQAK